LDVCSPTPGAGGPAGAMLPRNSRSRLRGPTLLVLAANSARRPA
jgi:hypothetical protein